MSGRMHFGDYRTPGTQTNQLFRLLLDMRPHTPPEIARELGTTNPTTIVSALRIALNDAEDKWQLPKAASERGGDGRIRHFYRLELRRPVHLELFSEAPRHELQGVA